MEQGTEPRLSRYLHAKAFRLGYPCAGTFELTPRCNFHCAMCYVRLSVEEEARRGRELTAEEWISLGEQACREGMVFLLLTGGEPTLRTDFPEIYTALKKMGLMISINSNGYLLRGEILELLRSDPPYRVNISLYGTSNETYQALCGVPAYETILENIRALRSAGIDVKLNMSLTDRNRDDLQAVYAQAQALDVHTQAAAYMFPPVRVTGRFGEGERMTAAEAARCEVAYQRLRMSPEEFQAYARRLTDGRTPEPSDEELCGARMSCRAGRSSFWISWDGRLSPCGMMPSPAENVLEVGFRDAWQRVRGQVTQIRLPAACSTCAYRHGCHVCAAMCYCETGRFDGKPEYLCEMTACYFELMRKEAEQ